MVLAAGAIGSPHILQLSGIGSGAVLKAAGVPVRHELAGVGDNLQDHLQVRFVYACTAKGSLNDVWHSRWQQMLTGIEYALKRSGILTIGAGAVGRSHDRAPMWSCPTSSSISCRSVPIGRDRACTPSRA